MEAAYSIKKMSITGSIAITTEFWAASFCLVAFIIIYTGLKGNERRRTLFSLMSANAGIMLICDAVSWICYYIPSSISRLMSLAALFMLSLMEFTMAPLLALYAEQLMDNRGSVGHRKYIYTVMGFSAFNVLLLIINQFTGIIYQVDENSIYHRNQDFFWLPVLVVLLSIAVIMAFVITERKHLGRSTFMLMICVLMVPAVGAVILSLFLNIGTMPFCEAIMLALILVYEVSEQKNDLTAREKENAEMRVALMVSQIGPHFIFNSLSSIKNICEKNSEDAVEAIEEFSHYLRMNLDSINVRECVSFSREAEHTKSYLSIENRRFRNRLKVVWDLETEDFNIPPLTLQPLVENAVKHGISGSPEGGTIWISTRELEDGYEVTVEDDGEGFEPAQPTKDGRIHVGVENVRSRLKDMCGGKLEIIGAPGVGAISRVFIPKAGTATDKK